MAPKSTDTQTGTAIPDQELGEAVPQANIRPASAADTATERLVAGCDDDAERLRRLAGTSH